MDIFEAIKAAIDEANKQQCDIMLYKDAYHGWFVSGQLWDDWLCRAHCDGTYQLSETGAESVDQKEE